MIHELGDRVARLSLEDLTTAARDRLLLCLFANYIVGIAGPRYSVIPEPRGAGPYRLLTGGTSSSAHDAVFYNAATMHARTQDDFDSAGNLHVGTVVVPALMAIADSKPVSGKDFLGGIAAGYMIAVSFARLCSRDTTPRGLRSTGLYSPFGATAAIGRVQRLPPDHISSALGLCTAFAAGTTQSWLDGSDEWQIHTGQAARSGLFANELASSGVRGGNHALDGKFGFFRAYTGKTVTIAELQPHLNPSAILEQSSIKRFPVSGICQSVVIGAERVAKRLAKEKATVKDVKIMMNSFERSYPGNLNRGPFRGFGDRLMSAAFCSSSVLSCGKFIFDDFHVGSNDARDRLVSVTEVIEDPQMPLLSCRFLVETDSGQIEEMVSDSRAEVAIDWTTVDRWARALWEEAGKPASSYDDARDLIRDLEKAPVARLPL